MKKSVVLSLLLIFVSASNVFSAEQMLPFQGGLTWRCDQGNNGITSHYGKLQHAWDFNLGGGSDDLGYLVLAPAEGNVVYAGMTFTKKRDADGNYVLDVDGNYIMIPGPWGNVVIIDYGNNEYGKIAHLSEVSVSVDDSVVQGQTVGKCGGTNGYSPHIHYQVQNSDDVNGQSIVSTFVDAEEVDRMPKKGGFYTSMSTYNPWNNFRIGKFSNGWRIREFDVCTDFSFQPYSRPFLMTYAHLAGKDANGKYKDAYTEVGFPLNEVHEFPDSLSRCFGNNPPALWIQDVRTVDGSKTKTFVLNPFVSNLRLDYQDASGTKYWLGVVFTLEGPMRNWWFNNYCQLSIGSPASEQFEETINSEVYVSQMFERSDNNYIKASFKKSTEVFSDLVSMYDEHVTVDIWENIGCPSGECGTGGPTEPEPAPETPPDAVYEFGQAVFCEGVQSEYPWYYINQKNVFYNSDDKVYVWVKLNNVYESVNIKWKWYAPSGNLALEHNHNTIDPTSENEDYYGWYHDNAYLNLTTESKYGEWEVQVFVNEVLEKSVNFVLDGCPSDSSKLDPGVCGCGTPDIDSDGDGTMDCQDNCPSDSAKINPGTCGCGVPDIDTDSDGTKDCQEECDSDPNKTSPGQCGCGVADTDTDGDGIPNCLDNCPDDSGKTEPGVCGCGTADTDSDGDGTADCNDECPANPDMTVAGLCGCDNDCLDIDGDGTPDVSDGCPSDPNKISAGQCGCGNLDTDTDSDGIADCVDEYPDDSNNGSGGLSKPSITTSEVIGQFNISISYIESAGASTYRVYREDTFGNEVTFDTTSLTFVDGPLETSRTYFYRVQAIDGTDVSALSDTKCFTVTADTTTVCMCPPQHLRIVPN